jgi:hypothetical protein
MIEDIQKIIEDCKKNLDNLSERANEYIVEHDKYLLLNVKDASVLKRQIKDLIVGVVDEDK